MWNYNWKYKQSFIISFSLLIIGFILEYFSNGLGVVMPSFPVNIFILLFILIYILLTAKFLRHPFINWLSSIPAAISVISIFTILILLMGFIPQVQSDGIIQKLGLNHIVSSWPYVLLSLNLLFILGYTILKRVWPINLRNIAFFLSHAGLWIVIAAASLGSGDLKRLSMVVEEGNTSWVAQDDIGNQYSVPFAIELIDFNIEVFAPELVYVDASTRKIVSKNTEKSHQRIEKGKFIEYDSLLVEIVEYYELAVKFDGEYRPVNEIGSVPAAYIKVLNKNTQDVYESWVTCGSFSVSTEFLLLDNNMVFAMTSPSPKTFSSDIKLYTPEKVTIEKTIKVNEALEYKGWKIYQISYDEEKGRWSKVSVFELVNDPWINVVYIGIFMLLAGSALIFWIGKSTKIN